MPTLLTDETFQHILNLLYNIYLLKLHIRHNYIQEFQIRQHYQLLLQHFDAITTVNIFHDILNRQQIRQLLQHGKQIAHG